MISFDVGTLLPALAPLLGSIVVLVLDVLDTRGQRVHYAVAFIALVIGMFGTFGGLGTPTGDELRTLCLPGGVTCFYGASALTTTLQLAALLAAAVTLLLAWPSERADETGRTAVTVALLLAATGGAVGVAGARDLGSWLVTLELATLPVVALAALPGTRRALAGAVQLVTTSLVSFAMLALGAACWYAATGSPELGPGPALAATSTPQRALLALSVVLILGGIGFKLSLVPFHAWTPTTYAGSPLPITVFLAGVSKVAALAALLVVVQAVT
ncbi:MAG TPA: proton-conducting transporter membrane subunit, partial [Lapillicoccus sp.]|nr:proton-conducting transporter membrane subunit [Lapillicoccus sp.]